MESQTNGRRQRERRWRCEFCTIVINVSLRAYSIPCLSIQLWWRKSARYKNETNSWFLYGNWKMLWTMNGWQWWKIEIWTEWMRWWRMFYCMSKTDIEYWLWLSHNVHVIYVWWAATKRVSEKAYETKEPRVWKQNCMGKVAVQVEKLNEFCVSVVW